MTIHRWPTSIIATSSTIHSHPIIWWFLSSPARSISHFFTDSQNTTYTTERVEEKRTNKHRLGLAPSTRREKFVTLSYSVSYRERVFEWNSHKVTRNANSSSHVGQTSLWFQTSNQSALLDFRWLLSPVEFSFLPPSLFCYKTFHTSSSSGLVVALTRKPRVLVSRQNRQKEPHSHLHDECPTSWHMVDFAVLADYRIKMKEIENKEKYLDFAWELKHSLK